MVGRAAYPANVPGDFYVEKGCCLMCEVPFAEAPGLFGTDRDPQGYPHCHVRRQPESAAELEQMLGAIRYADLRCIRCQGDDRRIQLRLVEIDEGAVCDTLPPDLQQEADRRAAESRRWWWQRRRPARRASASGRAAARRPWWRFW